MLELLLYLLAGFGLCFIGTIPFGPINLSVVKVTVDYGKHKGKQVAAAAALIETLQALIAIAFGLAISSFLESSPLFKLLLGTAFIVLAAYFFTAKAKSSLHAQQEAEASWFRRGLLIAALNPQAIPYWIFALAALAQYISLSFSGVNLFAFLIGVLLGKYLALYGFVLLSEYLQIHLKQSGLWVNRILVMVLALVGLNQLFSGITFFLNNSLN